MMPAWPAQTVGEVRAERCLKHWRNESNDRVNSKGNGLGEGEGTGSFSSILTHRVSTSNLCICYLDSFLLYFDSILLFIFMVTLNYLGKQATENMDS